MGPGLNNTDLHPEHRRGRSFRTLIEQHSAIHCRTRKGHKQRFRPTTANPFQGLGQGNDYDAPMSKLKLPCQVGKQWPTNTHGTQGREWLFRGGNSHDDRARSSSGCPARHPWAIWRWRHPPIAELRSSRGHCTRSSTLLGMRRFATSGSARPGATGGAHRQRA